VRPSQVALAVSTYQARIVRENPQCAAGSAAHHHYGPSAHGSCAPHFATSAGSTDVKPYTAETIHHYLGFKDDAD
jgi:hypothetical protein